MENSIITWYSLKKHRNRKFRFYTILVSDLGCILASFPGPLAMIFDICSSLIFGCFFGHLFHGARHQNGPKIAPRMTRESQKNRNLCSPLQFGGLDSNLAPFWGHFGRHLGSCGHLLAAIWNHFWTCLVAFGHLLLII